MPDRININVPDAINLASGLFADGHYTDAERYFRIAEQASGGAYEAVHWLGVCLNELERPAEALLQFDRAYVTLRDEMIALSSNRARALTELGRCDEAMLIYDGLLRSAPNDQIRYGRALALLQIGRHEECIAICDDVLTREPDNHKCRFARGFAKLVLGDYEHGFVDYECRAKDDISEPAVPLWTGDEDLRGKTILVHGEMGLGDNIMFMRYVPMLVKLGARVVVVVPESQRWLVPHGTEYRMADHATWPHLDYWVRFMSLALCFKTTRATVPPPIVLHHDQEKIAQWQDRIGQVAYLNVGLCWSGSLKSRYDAHRSIPLAQLAPLLAVPGVKLFSLQKDMRESDAEAFAAFGMIDLAPHLDTFEDTGNAMACMDVVITVDTSVAHMAGTVGVPTWIMLTQFRTYWLWIQKIETSPWYPSAMLFRQDNMGDWSGVVASVAHKMSALVAERIASRITAGG